MITELSHSFEKDNVFDVKDYLRLPMFLLTLDEFLIRGWNILVQPRQDEVQTHVEKITSDFLPIGYLKNRALESEAFNEEKIIIEPGNKLHDVPSQSDEVFHDWVKNRQLDEDWMNYYYEKSTIWPQLNETIRNEFRFKYGITLQQLVVFEKALIKTAQQQSNAGGNLPLPFIPEKLVTLMVEIMSKVDTIEEGVAKSFIKELEYTPDRTWSRSPLVKVKIGQKTRYTPILPALFVKSIVSNAWLEHISRGTRKSKSKGMLNEDWGKQFERYVRENLDQYHPDLIVDKGRMKIKRKKYPEIIDCTSNFIPEIDVIAQSSRCVYLISCKAMDHWIAFDNLSTFFLQNYKSFSKSIQADLENTGEISQIAECIEQSPKFLKDRGFSGKEIIPFLVCPVQRPLGLDSVRKWCLDNKLAYTLPKTKIIRANELKDYLFA